MRHTRFQRGAGGLETHPTLENHKTIGFLSNTCRNPLEKHNATKPVFNLGPLSACQRNAIEIAFRWLTVHGLH